MGKWTDAAMAAMAAEQRRPAPLNREEIAANFRRIRAKLAAEEARYCERSYWRLINPGEIEPQNGVEPIAWTIATWDEHLNQIVAGDHEYHYVPWGHA
jgi:hypothetical protein